MLRNGPLPRIGLADVAAQRPPLPHASVSSGYHPPCLHVPDCFLLAVDVDGFHFYPTILVGCVFGLCFDLFCVPGNHTFCGSVFYLRRPHRLESCPYAVHSVLAHSVLTWVLHPGRSLRILRIFPCVCPVLAPPPLVTLSWHHFLHHRSCRIGLGEPPVHCSTLGFG